MAQIIWGPEQFLEVRPHYPNTEIVTYRHRQVGEEFKFGGTSVRIPTLGGHVFVRPALCRTHSTIRHEVISLTTLNVQEVTFSTTVSEWEPWAGIYDVFVSGATAPDPA